MPCPFGTPNYVVVDYDQTRAQKLADSLGGAVVADSAQKAMEQTNIGCLTLMIASGVVTQQDQLQALLDHFDDYNAFIYDTDADPALIAKNERAFLEAERRSGSILPDLPEGIVMCLQVYGKRPRPVSAKNPTLVV